VSVEPERGIVDPHGLAERRGRHHLAETRRQVKARRYPLGELAGVELPYPVG
jgi:hypothetical protein